MSATVHYHHLHQSDDLVIDHYPDGDPSTGVVLLRDSSGAVVPELVSAIERTEEVPS